MLFFNFQTVQKPSLNQSISEADSCPRAGPHRDSELENTDCMVPNLFARGACVDEEWVVESPGLRRGRTLMRSWGGDAFQSRGGSLERLPGVWTGRHSPGTGIMHIRDLWGPQQDAS